MNSSMQITRIPFYKHHKRPLLFPCSLQQLAQIFLLHSSLNYSLNKEAFQSLFNIFSQGIMYREGPEKQVSRFNCASTFPLFCWPLLLVLYVHLLLHIYIKEYLFTFFIVYFMSLYVGAHSNGDAIKNMSL